MANPKRELPDTPAADDGDEWDVIPTGGLGDEWDFDRDGAMIGHYLGSRDVATPKVESGKATAHQFAHIDDPDRIVFVWESADLAGAFRVNEDGTSLIRQGDKCRITFLGERAFTSSDGQPRRIKQYKVEAAKRV